MQSAANSTASGTNQRFAPCRHSPQNIDRAPKVAKFSGNGANRSSSDRTANTKANLNALGRTQRSSSDEPAEGWGFKLVGIATVPKKQRKIKVGLSVSRGLRNVMAIRTACKLSQCRRPQFAGGNSSVCLLQQVRVPWAHSGVNRPV